MSNPEAGLSDLTELPDLSVIGNEEKPQLTATIDFDTEIAPNQFIFIKSGVGSGKNYFTDRLALGDKLKHHDGSNVRPFNILIVSSRRAKVDEIKNSKDSNYDDRIGKYDNFSYQWWLDGKIQDELCVSPLITLIHADGEQSSSEIPLRNATVTNAQIESFLRSWYFPACVESHLWQRFDMIIIDEVHSLIADAGYQEAPFYVRRLIEVVTEQNKDCKIICMTGTPEILDGYAPLRNAFVIDRMERCVNVVPKSMHFITRMESLQMQRDLLKKNQKFISFMNHVSDMLPFYEALPEEDKAKVVLTHSKQEVLDEWEKNKNPCLKRMTDVHQYLSCSAELPDNVIGFLSSSKNKEGINIKNDDIHFMFIESHAQIDIKQMAGRLRSGVDTLYLVVDSVSHYNPIDDMSFALSSNKSFLKGINEEYQKIYQQHGDPWTTDIYNFSPPYDIPATKCYIDRIHNNYPFIRFDYFTNNFMLYPECLAGKKYFNQQEILFRKARESKFGLVQWIRSIYPGIPCTISKHVHFEQQDKDLVIRYLTSKGFLDTGVRFNTDDKQKMISDLNELLDKNKKTLPALINPYGIRQIKATASNNRYSTWYLRSIPA